VNALQQQAQHLGRMAHVGYTAAEIVENTQRFIEWPKAKKK